MKSTFQTIRALIRKDMQIESHTREIFTVMLVFALSILFILNFALEQNVKIRTGSAAGLIWIILILAGQLGLNQIMGIEKQGNMIEALLASPVPRSAIYLSKTISAFVFMFLMALIIHPLYCIFYNVPMISPDFILVSALGCWGYAALGVLISAMTIQTRTRDILLPVLFYPLIIPLVVTTVKVTGSILSGENFSSLLSSLYQILAFDVIFTASGILGFELIVED